MLDPRLAYEISTDLREFADDRTKMSGIRIYIINSIFDPDK